jgi:pyridoxine 4-dehydrogenase
LQTWTLGDLPVNRLGFGAMRLTGSGPFHRGSSSDRERAIEVLRRAVELGVNHIDTAAFYFSPLRSANELINSALAPYPDGLVIATKVGPGRDPSGEWLPWAGPGQLRGQVEEKRHCRSLRTWARAATPTPPPPCCATSASRRPEPGRKILGG